MSKAAHNGCQARADIPTGLGMHQESTFAMSRLRHKRAVGKILPTAASVWVWSFSPWRRLGLGIGLRAEFFSVLRCLKGGQIISERNDLSELLVGFVLAHFSGVRCLDIY